MVCVLQRATWCNSRANIILYGNRFFSTYAFQFCILSSLSEIYKRNRLGLRIDAKSRFVIDAEIRQSQVYWSSVLIRELELFPELTYITVSLGEISFQIIHNDEGSTNVPQLGLTTLVHHLAWIVCSFCTWICKLVSPLHRRWYCPNVT